MSPFNVGSTRSMAETQDEIVAERTPAVPEALEEVLNLPGIQYLHEMKESELADFFLMVLKSRPLIREMRFSLGDYEAVETQSRVPNCHLLHTMEFQKVAQVLTSALGTGQNVIGFRAVISSEKDGSIASRLFIRTSTKKLPKAPVFNEFGTLVTAGDPEWNPTLVVVSRPTNI